MKSRPALMLITLLTACRPAEADVSATAAADTIAAASLPPAAPEQASERLPADRIYYDLTRFEWYARGQPLLHEGVGYQPAGMPVPAPASEMKLLGEYEGVEYYRREADDGLLFVPVFDGYWLAFRATGPALVQAD
jgi:hypothetical protein